VISLDGIRKKFVTPRGTVEALAGVHLSIDDGEFVCLVGPSGCGKTTLLHLIAGLDRPDQGEVRIDGRPVVGPGPDRGVLFQEAALFPWLSVIANVELGMAWSRVPRSERKARARVWLHAMGLDGFARSSVHELSGGMQRRAALARVLALEPAILLMDEPCSALDPTSTRRIEETIGELQEQVTIVIVTHNMHQAARVSQHCAFFLAAEGRPGEIVEQGPTEKMFFEPDDQRTLDYVTGRFG